MFLTKHQKFMEQAKICSFSSNYAKYKIGCVIVLKCGKRYFGFNQQKSHPLQSKFSIVKTRKGVAKAINSFLHAEMHAITIALRYHSLDEIENASVYVYRVDLNGNHAMCRPCLSCMAAIKHYNISNIFYTTNDSQLCHEKIS